MFSFWRKRPPVPVTETSALPYPLSPRPPIAVFDKHHPIILRDAKTVAAPLHALREIETSFWRPEYPLVVLSYVEGGLISEDDRDWLWTKFQVPAFEYLLDTKGRILARECEAHEGLHLESDTLRGVILDDVCPCGKPGPRLLALDAIIEKSVAVPTLTQEWRNWQTHQT